MAAPENIHRQRLSVHNNGFIATVRNYSNNQMGFRVMWGLNIIAALSTKWEHGSPTSQSAVLANQGVILSQVRHFQCIFSEKQKQLRHGSYWGQSSRNRSVT
jgi:hypothetical protein